MRGTWYLFVAEGTLATRPTVTAATLRKELRRLEQDIAMLLSRFEELTGERVREISVGGYQRVDIDNQPRHTVVTVLSKPAD